MKRKLSVVSIVLYVLAGLLALYTIWSITNIVDYIAQQQVTFKGNEYNVLNFYMSNAGQYGIFAVILFALGWAIQKQSPVIETANDLTEAEYAEPETIMIDAVDEEPAYSVDESTTETEDAQG